MKTSTDLKYKSADNTVGVTENGLAFDFTVVTETFKMIKTLIKLLAMGKKSQSC